ncbi:hypothetical protein D5B42_23140 [Salmonella enterica subsp. enterica serovar Oranienburg]|nr:hypothetical protein [Salmonella enterica subsp. enterica serovar Oranienburg]
MKAKYLLIALSMPFLLTGCISPTTNAMNDYKTFCPDYTPTNSDVGKIVSVQNKKIFYSLSDGSIHSQRELDALNSPQSVLMSQFLGAVQNRTYNASTDPKSFVAIQYRKNDNSQLFCGNVSDDDKANTVNIGQKLKITNVKGSVSSSDFYKNDNNISKGIDLVTVSQ